MNRARLILGVLAGTTLVGSAAAHTLLGWKSLADRLTNTNVSSDLETGLRIGWMFGGAAMALLGVIAIATFVGRLRGATPTFLPVVAISVTYMAFGAWAIAQSGGDLFFLGVFVVPGALLGIAANGHGR